MSTRRRLAKAGVASAGLVIGLTGFAPSAFAAPGGTGPPATPPGQSNHSANTNGSGAPGQANKSSVTSNWTTTLNSITFQPTNASGPGGNPATAQGMPLPNNNGAGSTTWNCTVQPQPNYNNSTSGANASGPYNATGCGQVQGGHNAGSVGKADNKNPRGQLPGGSDNNKGYECDRNPGIGNGNPAHTACTNTPTPPPPSGGCQAGQTAGPGGSCTTPPPPSGGCQAGQTAGPGGACLGQQNQPPTAGCSSSSGQSAGMSSSECQPPCSSGSTSGSSSGSSSGMSSSGCQTNTPTVVSGSSASTCSAGQSSGGQTMANGVCKSSPSLPGPAGSTTCSSGQNMAAGQSAGTTSGSSCVPTVVLGEALSRPGSATVAGAALATAPTIGATKVARLAFTGANMAGLALLSGALLLIGALLVVATRRRQSLAAIAGEGSLVASSDEVRSLHPFLPHVAGTRLSDWIQASKHPRR